MVIKIPKYRSFWPSLEVSSKCSGWEISVSTKDDIAWSIVLSYLIPADHKEFERRWRTLTGTEEGVQSALKAVRSFNPFRNRYACFFDKTMKEIIARFKKKLSWNSLIRVPDKLSAASKFLHCPILLIKQIDDNMKTEVFNENAKEIKEGKSEDVIVLFASLLIDEESQTTDTIYTFLLNQQLGLKLKRSALLYFLREAGFRKKRIRQIMDVVESGNHFLISILKSNFRMVINDLYKLPYIVTKLTEAGYETDPKSTDSEELSALYHALFRADSKLLYRLYFFAANSCFESKGTYRIPDCHIVYNLQEIGKILQNDLLKSNNFRDCKNQVKIRKTFDQLLRLNKFLIESTTNLLKIREKLNYYDTVSDEEYEARKRCDIIVSSLKVYEEFFKMDKLEDSITSPLEDYIKHKQYYYFIDITEAILFFDNIIYLKERLFLENNMLSDMEEQFLFLVFFQVFFNEISLKTITDFNLGQNPTSIYALPSTQRECIISKVKEFRKILQDTIISKDINLRKSIPKKEIYAILQSYPEIKDYIEINRLKFYLNTAINVKVVDVKSCLVIERALQVLGEYMNPEPGNDFSVLRRIFPLCLPNAISRILRRIRNELTHLKGHTFPAKFECEKNFSLFKSIQKEIRSINMYFKPVFKIQKLSEVSIGIKKFKEYFKKMKDSIDSHTNEYIDLCLLSEDLLLLCEQVPKLYTKSNTKNFVLILEIVLINLEEELKNEVLNTTVDILNVVKHKLWPLKFLLELSVIFPPFLSKHTSTLFEILLLIEQSNSIDNLQAKIDNFIIKCKELILKFKRLNRKDNLKIFDNCEIFLNILKGFIYLSENEKDEIRKEIPISVKESVEKKKRLISSIDDGFSLNVEEQLTEFELSYLSNKKQKMLVVHYRNKNIKALDILKMNDPITELEEILCNNSVKKKNYESLCEVMEFSDKTKKKLWKLVAGQRQKAVVNNLLNLQFRIRLLREILIEDNKEIAEQWIRIKSEKSQQHFVKKLVNLFLRDDALLASIETLLFDCMILFENEKSIKNPWIKSSKLYSGYNLRNIMSHGNPLLESLCNLLDPDDLLTEMTCKVLWLIENEDTIAAILELYQRTNNDFSQLLESINMAVNDEHLELKFRIKKRRKIWKFGIRTYPESNMREDWENFILLIPHNSDNLLD